MEEKVEIRQIDLNKDVKETVRGMRDFISRMDYNEFVAESDDELIACLQRLINLGCVTVTVAEHEGRLIGGIGMLYAPCLWNSHINTGEELFWWVDRNAPKATALKLLRAAKDQAKTIGCKYVTFKSLTSSPEGVDRVYRKMGMRPVEMSYMGAL